MSWFERLAPFRRGGSAVAEAIREEASDPTQKSSPPLMCLVSDASGRASFKTHLFDDSESATEFVNYWFPAHSQGGIIAFWAMTHEPSLEPSSQITAEPLVMVRDMDRDGVVYLFSFSDLESAQAFLQDEVRHGTDLAAMMLYWAVPVRMEADAWGKLRLTPALPPGAFEEAPPDNEFADMWTALPVAAPEPEVHEVTEGAQDVFEEAANARTGVASPDSPADETFQLTAWMERARRKPLAAGDPEFSQVAPSPIPSVEPALAGAQANRESGRADDEILWFDDDSLPQPQMSPLASNDAFVSEPMDEAPRLEPLPADESIRFGISEPDTFQEPADAVVEVEPVLQTVATSEGPMPVGLVEEESLGFPDSALVAAGQQSFEAPPVIERVAEDAAPLVGAEDNIDPLVDEGNVTPETIDVTQQYEVDQPKISVYANGSGPLHGAGGRDDGAITVGPAEVIVHKNGSANEPAPNGAAAGQEAVPPVASGKPARNDDEDLDHGLDIRIEIHLNSSRALKIKRWESKDEPFDGFNSPPGRF